MKTQKSKKIIPEKKSENMVTGKNKILAKIIESKIWNEISSTSPESHTVNSSLFCQNHGSNHF